MPRVKKAEICNRQRYHSIVSWRPSGDNVQRISRFVGSLFLVIASWQLLGKTHKSNATSDGSIADKIAGDVTCDDHPQTSVLVAWQLNSCLQVSLHCLCCLQNSHLDIFVTNSEAMIEGTRRAEVLLWKHITKNWFTENCGSCLFLRLSSSFILQSRKASRVNCLAQGHRETEWDLAEIQTWSSYTTAPLL
jgi:hypothetical protein